LREIEQIPILAGNRRSPIAELFAISGSPDDRVLEIVGSDNANLHGVGSRMAEGEIRIQGTIGRHLGAQMSGGTIVVDGNAGDWAGAEMRGGLIHIHGCAGHSLGAAYRGSTRGMTGGTILVDSQAGNEIGRAMRRGLIAVGGNAGDAVGFGLLAGTIVVGGSLGIRSGANMRRGTIMQLGAARPTLLPTFEPSCRMRPTFWRVLVGHLRQLGCELFDKDLDREFELFKGDMLEGGRGDLFIPTAP
jgi:formylmethanofuran dehydrogenase subunit C